MTKRKNNRRYKKNRSNHSNLLRWSMQFIQSTTIVLLHHSWSRKEDPRVPLIDCSINERSFFNTFCDLGSSVNIMPKVTYQYLFKDTPLHSLYVQLQMIDQTYRFPKGIAKDVMVKIRDHYVPTDFVVLDTRDEEQDPSIILGRPFLNTTNTIIYIKTRKIHFYF